MAAGRGSAYRSSVMERAIRGGAALLLAFALGGCTGDAVHVTPPHSVVVPYPQGASVDAAAGFAYIAARSHPAVTRDQALRALRVEPGPSVSIDLVRAWDLHAHVIDGVLVWRVTREGLCLQPIGPYGSRNVPCSDANHEDVGLVDARTGTILVGYTER
jgi:hypothetical protein